MSGRYITAKRETECEPACAQVGVSTEHPLAYTRSPAAELETTLVRAPDAQSE